jgi:hypothetical protein
MNYKRNSPYFDTPLSTSGEYLEQLVSRNVPAAASDNVVEITAKYNQRPDLMAYDLYRDPKLWWVFAERNPNVLVDPVGDFVTGTLIFIPNPAGLIQNLGL